MAKVTETGRRPRGRPRKTAAKPKAFTAPPKDDVVAKRDAAMRGEVEAAMEIAEELFNPDASSKHDKDWFVRPLGANLASKLAPAFVRNCIDESEALRVYYAAFQVVPTRYKCHVSRVEKTENTEPATV